jgi:hypothetical protein
MPCFVWTKMQAEAGQSLASILEDKERQRIAGNGIFWWGIGSSLGAGLQNLAQEAGGTLPILFSRMLGRPKQSDSSPAGIVMWRSWTDELGHIHPVPGYAKVSSREHGRSQHYALVCKSDRPIAMRRLPFDPSRCRTPSGKLPGASQVTALLLGDLDDDHSAGAYEFGFRATLVEPWFVKLIRQPG